jgi:hypothetical protein
MGEDRLAIQEGGLLVVGKIGVILNKAVIIFGLISIILAFDSLYFPDYQFFGLNTYSFYFWLIWSLAYLLRISSLN